MNDPLARPSDDIRAEASVPSTLSVGPGALGGAAGPAIGERPQFDRALLGQRIAADIRRRILIGELRPGQRLRQRDVCGEYGVSRMPVRDALKLLEHEAFVEANTAGHAAVASLTRDELEMAYAIEASLHGLATVRAAERATEEDLQELESLCGSMERAVNEANVDVMDQLNWSFHRKINHLSASRRLVATLQSASLGISRGYFRREDPAVLEGSVREHRELVRLLRERRSEEASALMVEHVRSAGSALIASLMTDQSQLPKDGAVQ